MPLSLDSGRPARIMRGFLSSWSSGNKRSSLASLGAGTQPDERTAMVWTSDAGPALFAVPFLRAA